MTASINNLEEIRIFNQVVKSKGFSAAADVLQLPVNLISRRVASLEQQLGVKLLNRTTRQISLTDEGQLLFNRSADLLAGFDKLANDINQNQATISGAIRLAVRTTTVEFGIVEKLAELVQQHSQLEIQLFVSDEPIDIVQEGIDLALVIGDLPDSSLAAKRIGDVIFCLCAASSYISDPTMIQSPDDLLKFNYILSWQKQTPSQLKLCAKNGTEVLITPKSRFKSNDVRTRARAIVSGIGIGTLPYAEAITKSKTDNWSEFFLTILCLQYPFGV
ncbi:MAG: LysR family transcriptional regulator [Cellvibrio sp.]|nr:LysR family transcriptional regulator [Cellvibrio sp.]